MSDRYQTQCPHCGVKFQITAQQLQLAGGTVRCGSCLQVFQATQNLVPLTATPPAGVGSARGGGKAPPADSQATIQRPAISVPPAAPPARPPTAKAPPAARPPADDDLADMILRELDGRPDAAKAPPPAARPPAAKPPAPKPPAAKPAAPAPGGWTPPPAGNMPPPAKPAGWGAPPPAKPAAPAKPQTSAEKYGIQENKTKIKITGEQIGDKLETADPFGVESTTLDEKDFQPESDESWAKALIGEKPLDERDERVRKFQISASDLSIADPTAAQPRSALEERLSRLASNEMPSPIRRTAPAGGSQVDDEFDFLSDPGLTMQDVELPALDDSGDALLAAAQNHHVTWGGDFFWGTLSAVFLLVLLGQYMLFNKETLARDPSWRGAYEVACGAVGCALPKDSDIARIQGANLVIRSHPTVPGALIVDAIVYNRAGFAQPFPRIQLGFDDAQGNPVAGRTFLPAEYLKGELLDAKLMPPDTPIHLALEIADPGTGAANYELRFLPAAGP